MQTAADVAAVAATAAQVFYRREPGLAVASARAAFRRTAQTPRETVTVTPGYRRTATAAAS